MAIITITRGVQSGGRELARRLSERLEYQCLSREVISQCSRKYNIMEDDLYQKLMEAPRLWQRLSQEHKRYLIYIQCSLIDAAKRDNIIYHGYAGQLFLKGVRHALKLRLDMPLETRIEAEMREYDKNWETAKEYIERMDEQQNRWVRFLYGKDWHDPALYDLSINLEHMTIDTVCEIVEKVLSGSDYSTTKESVNILDDLSLKCEVQAALTADDNLWNQDVKVRAVDSAVVLSGSVKNANIRDDIISLVTQVKGVTKCESQLGLLSDSVRRGYFGGK